MANHLRDIRYPLNNFTEPPKPDDHLILYRKWYETNDYGAQTFTVRTEFYQRPEMDNWKLAPTFLLIYKNDVYGRPQCTFIPILELLSWHYVPISEKYVEARNRYTLETYNMTWEERAKIEMSVAEATAAHDFEMFLRHINLESDDDN